MTRPQIIRFALCTLAAFVQGWVVLKFYALGVWLLYFGIVGAIPFLLLNGVHGDAKGPGGCSGRDAVCLDERSRVLRHRNALAQAQTPEARAHALHSPLIASQQRAI